MGAGTSVQFLAPESNFVAVTPSDTVNLAGMTKGIYVGGAGNIVCINSSGTAITFTGVLAGMVYPIRTSRVNSTSTTATNLVAFLS